MSLALSPKLRRLVSGPRILVALLPLLAICPASAQSRVTLETRLPDTVSYAIDAGPIPSSQRLTLTLTLAPTAARATALDQFLADVLTPSSPSYRHWLTPQQFAATYGATSAQIAAASTWLESQGLTLDAVSPSGTRIAVSGFASQIQPAFAVTLHTFQVRGGLYFGNTNQPSLPPVIAPLFAAINGLNDFPSTLNARPSTLTLPALAAVIDANADPILAVDATFSIDQTSPAEQAGLSLLFRQAAAQGITTLVARNFGVPGFPANFPEVTAVTPSAGQFDASSVPSPRPTWQTAPGLPADTLRHVPDLEASSLSAFAQTLTSIALKSGGRLGNINPALYTLAAVPGLYTQPDAVPAGTWEPATGLGLVDLSKLAQSFPNGVSTAFISFSSTNYTPTHGQSVSFTSAVTSGTGGATPTGTVTFTANGATLATVALVGGSATYTTNSFDGGNYTLLATYSGDATYASVVSSQASIYVKPEPSNLGVTVSGGAVVGGTFTVIITDTAASGVGRPTGAVTVTLPGSGSAYSGTLAPASANSATATITIPASTVGTLTLSITCTTSVSFDCSNPYTTTITISKATPTLNISYTPNPAVSGQSIILNATVTGVGTAPTPTGNVIFYDNTTVLNAGALSSGATTTSGVVPTTATHVITATYQGDPNYNAVSTTPGSTTSGAISTTLTLNASASTVTPGKSITFTAVVIPASTGSAPPSGIVQFFDGVTLLGLGTVSQNVATFATATLSSTANHPITAIYVGDTNYTGSTSPVLTIGKTVVPITTVTALGASASTIITGQPITFTATITPASAGAAGPTGTVQFFDGASPLGSATVTANIATYTTSLLSGSTAHAITAVYAGDTLYSGSTSPVLSIGKNASATATTTVLSGTPATAPQGSPIVLTALITPTVNNIPPTGTVQFTTGGTLLCSATVTGSTAACTVTSFALGNTSVIASYLGDATYAASTSNTLTVTITAGNATLVASISPAIVAGGATATVTAILSAPNGTVPAGSITATVLGVTGAIYSVALPGTPNTSTVTVMIPIPGPAIAGTYSVVVSCAGSNFTCAPVTVTLISSGGGAGTGKIPTSTVLTAAPSTTTPGATTLTATVTPLQVATTIVTGSVVFFDGTTQIGTAPVTLATASVTVALAATTSHILTAVYSGDPIFATSTSAPIAGTTTGANTTVALSSNVSTSIAGINVVFTAIVSNASSTVTGTPTGTVSFFIAGATPALFGTVTVGNTGNSTATATFSTSNLPAGALTIYAVYNGDSVFNPSISNQIKLGLSDFTVAFVPQNMTLKLGLSGQATVVAGAVGGFAGTVVFGCTPPPNTQITCSFAPAAVKGGGNTTLTIVTTLPKGQALGGGNQASLRVLGGITLAALCCGFLRRRRIPALLLVLLALGLTFNAGCSANNFNSIVDANNGGTPLGTTLLIINTVGTDGTNSVRHNYTYQVTVQ